MDRTYIPVFISLVYIHRKVEDSFATIPIYNMKTILGNSSRYLLSGSIGLGQLPRHQQTHKANPDFQPRSKKK